MSGHDDFEREAQPGLPEPLPPEERMLWQGSPDWRSLARHAFHVRKVIVYFTVLAVWFLIEAWHDGTRPGQVAVTVSVLAGVGGVAVGLLLLMAWLSAREAIYTITDQRVVVRFGVALRLTLNVPFTIVDGLALRLHDDGTGDLPLSLSGSDRVSYLVLWPHARPWHLRRPQIMLRCIADAERVAELLGTALVRHAPGRRQPQTVPLHGEVALS